LALERSAHLEVLPGWNWNPRDADWEEGFARLEGFALRDRHTSVSDTYLEDGYRLGQWVQVQRAAYSAGRLSAERIARLETLPGWAWKPFVAGWEAGFASLECFAAREGHTRVSHEHLEDGYRLGQWVKVQRRAWRVGKLSAQRDRPPRSTPRLDAHSEVATLLSREVSLNQPTVRAAEVVDRVGQILPDVDLPVRIGDLVDDLPRQEGAFRPPP
jgi:hypothetical protein